MYVKVNTYIISQLIWPVSTFLSCANARILNGHKPDVVGPELTDIVRKATKPIAKHHCHGA